MNATVKKALGLWGMIGADFTLVAARENAVYRVDTPTGPVAMRLHRKGYRTDDELRSELLWMKAVADGGITVPEPIPSVQGQVLAHVDDIQVDVLTWLTGVTMTTELDLQNATER